jgi:uncharacterized membrane protein HdeD (DUF308 family)
MAIGHPSSCLFDPPNGTSKSSRRIKSFGIGYSVPTDGVRPCQALLAVTLLLIVFLMVEGISKVIFALTIRPFPNWGWVLASGIIGILLALYLWASLPITAIWLLGVLLGIQLICEGAAIGYLAWQVRNS